MDTMAQDQDLHMTIMAQDQGLLMNTMAQDQDLHMTIMAQD